MNKLVGKLPLAPLVFPPEGMIRPGQGLRLAALAFLTRGNILEIGSWIGRSTSYLTTGLKLKGSGRKVVTIDNHFSSREDFERFFGESLDKKPQKKRDEYLRHITRPGGTVESLKDNLRERGLLKSVEIYCGDFLNFEAKELFGFIFCDATHDENEVKRNVPKILTLLKEDAVLVCDDFRYENMFAALKQAAVFDCMYMHKYMLFASRGAKANRILKLACLGCRRIK